MHPIKPSSIRLEASSACQLKCTSCETAQGKTQATLGRGFLAFDNFQKIVDDNPWINHIELSNWGEIFLNPDLLKILEYAHQKNIVLSASNGANLNTVKPEVLEGLVKYQFRLITCALDGGSQETYRIYRVNGDFDRVIENIKTINHYKEVYQSQFPILQWQFILFSHNEHEIEVAQNLAKSLDMKFYLKLSWDESIAQMKNPDLIRKLLGAANRSEYYQFQGEGYLQKGTCSQLWNSPQINWDGQLLGCCYNYWSNFGNVLESGMENALNNEKMNYARQMLTGEVDAMEDIPCTNCGHYTSMKASKKWLTKEDIKSHKLRNFALIRPSIQKLCSESNQSEVVEPDQLNLLS